MESEITRKAQAKIDQVKAELKRITSAQEKMMLEGHEAERKLEPLRAELGGVLTKWAMGEIAYSEVTAHKAQIAELGTYLADLTEASQALEAMEQPLRISMREPQRLLRKVRDYEWLKDGISENGSVSKIPNLRDLAGVLGFQDDAESFISQLPQMRS